MPHMDREQETFVSRRRLLVGASAAAIAAPAALAAGIADGRDDVVAAAASRVERLHGELLRAMAALDEAYERHSQLMPRIPDVLRVRRQDHLFGLVRPGIVDRPYEGRGDYFYPWTALPRLRDMSCTYTCDRITKVGSEWRVLSSGTLWPEGERRRRDLVAACEDHLAEDRRLDEVVGVRQAEGAEHVARDALFAALDELAAMPVASLRGAALKAATAIAVLGAEGLPDDTPSERLTSALVRDLAALASAEAVDA